MARETGREARTKQKEKKEVFHMTELQNTPTPHIGAKQGRDCGDNSASGRSAAGKVYRWCF